MSELRSSTLLFLLREHEGRREICLALKKRGFGKGRWNGTGGKVEEGEMVEEAAVREAREEIGVMARELKNVAELSFFFPHNLSWDQCVHVFFAHTWDGEPTESEEMRPEWFSVHDIPWENMWPDDPFWLPRVLDGASIKARFVFGEGDVIQEKEVWEMK